MRRRRLGLAVAVTTFFVVFVARGAAVRQEDTLEVQLQRATALASQGQYIDALAAYRAAAKADNPTIQFPAQVGIVRCSLRTAQFPLARAVATALIAAHPGDVAVRGLYGDALWSSGLFDWAERAYLDTLALRPDAARGHNGLARVLLARGRLDEALIHAEAAIGLTPGDPEVQQTAGMVLERMRRYPEAASAFQAFVDLVAGKAKREEGATWARARVQELRAFGRRKPYDVGGISRPGVRHPVSNLERQDHRERAVQWRARYRHCH